MLCFYEGCFILRQDLCPVFVNAELPGDGSCDSPVVPVPRFSGRSAVMAGEA